MRTSYCLEQLFKSSLIDGCRVLHQNGRTHKIGSECESLFDPIKAIKKADLFILLEVHPDLLGEVPILQFITVKCLFAK